MRYLSAEKQLWETKDVRAATKPKDIVQIIHTPVGKEREELIIKD